jgi:hypothetical protein
VALPLPNLPAPDFGNETNVLRAEFTAGLEKAFGDLANLETRVTSLQTVDRERLVRIEDSVERIHAEVRAETHAEFEAKLTQRERSFEARFAELKRSFEAKITELEERMQSTAGELPQVRNWKPETVYYRGQLVASDGALYQTKQDTATMPGSADWTLVTRAGRDGASVTPKGGFDPTDAYGPLDVVMYKDASYIAVRADPGRPADSDGWMMLAARGPEGKQGKPGPMGSARRQG